MPASVVGAAAVVIAVWQFWPSSPAPKPVSTEPRIEDFQASPTSITQGDEITLTWSTSEVDSVRLDPLGTVHLANGSVADTPDGDTEYTLWAYGPGGEGLRGKTLADAQD